MIKFSKCFSDFKWVFTDFENIYHAYITDFAQNIPYNTILLLKTFITGNRKRATRKALKSAMTNADAVLGSPSIHHAFKKMDM